MRGVREMKMKNDYEPTPGMIKIMVLSLLFVLLLVPWFGLSCKASETLPPETVPQLTEETPASTPPPTPAATPAVIEVVIEGNTYKPVEIKVSMGSTVIWYNRDAVIHTVTARDRTFDSGSLRRNDTFSYTFHEAGTFEYYCIPHPYMIGKVIVE